MRVDKPAWTNQLVLSMGQLWNRESNPVDQLHGVRVGGCKETDLGANPALTNFSGVREGVVLRFLTRIMSSVYTWLRGHVLQPD